VNSSPNPAIHILETLDSKNMTQVELAERMGKNPFKDYDIILEGTITTATALQLKKFLKE